MLPTGLSPVIVDTSSSPHARLRPVPLNDVWLTGGFWGPVLDRNRMVSLPVQFEMLESTGRLDNFRRAGGDARIPFRGQVYDDSDVYKWLEAASWTLAGDRDEDLEERIDRVSELILDAQGGDGYLSTYFSFENASLRWSNLRDWHELYCAGHLIQAAIAHHRTTGTRLLLGPATRFADLICERFRGESGIDPAGTGGHPEIEMALVELYRETGESRYLTQAWEFFRRRGAGAVGGDVYHLDHQPFNGLERLEGHAVRAVYLACGAADICAETGDPGLLATLERLWSEMTTRRMYITGGIGARAARESFGVDYELPNRGAYAESCAAIGNFFLNWRMFLITGQPRYLDLMERVMYNAALVGVSLDGRDYFYSNPLEDDGSHRRRPWYTCACCPPNLARWLASLPGYFYCQNDRGIWINHFANGGAHFLLSDGAEVSLEVTTTYPWDGEITIQVQGEGEFSIYLRVPEWAGPTAELWVLDRESPRALNPGTIVEVRRAWRTGDLLRLSLPMVARFVESHPYVEANRRRAAIQRGPLLYCLEQADHPGLNPQDLSVSGDAALQSIFEADVLGGVVTVNFIGNEIGTPSAWSGHLYLEREALRGTDRSSARDRPLRAVPYYAWGNRSPGWMRVWLGW